MILTGTRPPWYAELRERAHDSAEREDEAREVAETQAGEPARSAVEIAPRPPSDQLGVRPLV